MLHLARRVSASPLLTALFRTHHRRLILVAMASVLLLSGCMLSPLFQAPAAVMTGIAVLLGLAACGGGGGGGGGGSEGGGTTYTAPTVPGCASNLSVASAPVTWPAFAQIGEVKTDFNLGFSLFDQVSGTKFGHALAAGCDLNGDGKFDLAVGRPYYVGSSQGMAVVVFGSSTINTDLGTLGSGPYNLALVPSVAFHELVGQNAFGVASWSLAMGDVNGDGTADLVIGEPSNSSGASGTAWVVFGGGTFTGVSCLALGGELGFIDNTGSRVDGFRITTTEMATIGEYSGLAQVFGGNHLGRSVAVAELAGDTLGDVIVGGPANSFDPSTLYGNYAGIFPRAAVVFGAEAAVAGASYDISGKTFAGEGSYAGTRSPSSLYDTSMGYSVAVAGDLNGDGVLDVIAGAPNTYFTNGGEGNTYGKAHVIFGKAGLTGQVNPDDLTGKGFSILGDATNNDLGQKVAPAGDVNGDGILDVMVKSRSLSGQGHVHVVFGKSSGTAWSSQVAASQLSTTGQGFTVTLPDVASVSGLAAADVNGDGIADLLIGSSNATVNDGLSTLYGYAGAVFVVFGKSGITDVDLNTPLNGSNGFQIVGPSNARIGRAIAVGDINGDGKADIIVSGEVYNGETNFYGIYVIFGGDSAGELPAVPGSDLNIVVLIG